jgi:hypothetical protein
MSDGEDEGKPIIRDELGRIAKGSGSLHPGGHYAESSKARKELAKYVQGSIDMLGKIGTGEKVDGVEVPLRVRVEAAKFIVERFVARADSEVQGKTADDNLRAIRELLSPLTPKN